MDFKNLSNMLAPFTDLTQYLKALDIIKTKYSINKKNYLEVTASINTILKINLSIQVVTSIIVQVERFPQLYGYDFIQNANKFQESNYRHSASNNEHTTVISPSIEKCLLCKSNPKLIYKSPIFAKDAMLYKQNKIEKCIINTKFCIECESFFYISYTIDAKAKQKIFYPGAHKFAFFHVSNESIFSKELMECLLSDIIFNHTTFRGFTNSYNRRHHNFGFDRFKLCQARLADAFFALHLCKFLQINCEHVLKSQYDFIYETK
jgi:hypothetical protein